MIDQPVPKLKVGGTLGLDDLYVRRVEDDTVFDALAERDFCNVLTSRQMGKSSLMVRLMIRLQKERGARIACVDLAGDVGAPMKSENGQSVPDPDSWYIGFLAKIAADLGIDCDVGVWWRNDGQRTPNGRLLQFFRTLVAPEPEQPVFIFVDEVDFSLKLPYSDDFFTAVRAIYNQRSTTAEYRSITFCLIGVASPGELIKDRHTTPYNVGRTIELRDFDPKLNDLTLLYAAMSVKGAPGADLVHAVLHHSGGHPFLTVALCALALAKDVRTVGAIDALIHAAILAKKSNDALTVHFASISTFFSNRPDHERETLRLYDTILRGGNADDRVTPAHLDLRLSGLVKHDHDGRLAIRNRIYKRRFGRAWLAQMAQPHPMLMKKRVRRWWISLTGASLSVALAAIFFVLAQRHKLDCKTALQDGSNDAALAVCEGEYEQTRDLHTAVYTADLRWRAGNLDGAAALASGLLATDVHGEALRILGEVAFAQRRVEDAFKLIQEASEVHRRGGRHVELARDLVALNNIQTAQNRYADAITSHDECLIAARAADDETLEATCHLSVVRALTFAGYLEWAEEKLARAEQRIHKDRDLALLWYERGTLYQKKARDLLRRSLHQTQDLSAIVAFERSLEFAERAKFAGMMCDIDLSLAHALADAGRTDAADVHLAESAVGACSSRLEAKRREVTARIAYRRGDLPRAFLENEAAYPTILDEEERFDVCTMQASIALERNDAKTAMFWAKRGIEVADRVVAVQGQSELRSWMLASRREPFEILFVALVRLERVNDAIAVFDQWQGRTLLGEGARTEPAITTRDEPDSGEELRKIDVVALVVALGDAWRVTADRGRFRIVRLGEFARLADRLARFRNDPTDPALGNDLGALILSADIIRKTEAPLYVALDIPFSALPFVALRYDEHPVVAERPIARIPRLLMSSSDSCDVYTGRGHSAAHALVLADANGDLPQARLEGERAASLLGVTPLVGRSATSAALFSASPGTLLHIAVHAQDQAESRVLMLGDRTVSAQEIARHGFSASLVILSGPSTGVDSGLGISLATAFLASKSQYVIATLRPVADAGARALIDAFYSEHGVEDPVRGLARVQARFSATDNKEWASLAVFSRCLPRE